MTDMGLCSVCAEAPAVVTILKCDFCGRDQRNVPILVKGPFGSDICDECVEDAAAVIAERRQERAAKQGIEARQGGDGEAGSVHESPSRAAGAPDTRSTILHNHSNTRGE